MIWVEGTSWPICSPCLLGHLPGALAQWKARPVTPKEGHLLVFHLFVLNLASEKNGPIQVIRET